MKYLFLATLTFLSGTALYAESDGDDSAIQPYENVRTGTVSIYAGGGVSGFHGLRGVSETGISSTFMAPDFFMGIKVNYLPYFRFGYNIGYTKIKAQNSALDTLTTVTENYPVGDYEGKLIVRSATLDNRYDQHQLYMDLNVDVNPIVLFGTKARSFNLWLGTGFGYLHGWNRHTLSTAYDEEAVSRGDDHFNVYNHSYITTDVTTESVNTFYVPFRLSLEYDFTPQWTMGLKGEYKYMPMRCDLTPTGLWSCGLSLAYNFTTVPTATRQLEEQQHNIDMATLNDRINELRQENDQYAASNTELNNSLKAANSELTKFRKATPPISQVFFTHNSAAVTTPITNAADIKKLLNDYPYYSVHVCGYASSGEGNAKAAMALSKKRAQAVANILMKSCNIPSNRIVVEAKGNTGNALVTAAKLQRMVLIYFLEQDLSK